MEIKIREFAAGDEAAFRGLNEAWITAFFVLEAKDIETLSDPKGQILESGGAILIAECAGRPVGCCALLPDSEGGFEVGKMAVAEEMRGLGIGRKLLDFVIGHARSLGATRLSLETNRKLSNAVHLYQAAGFEEVPADRQHASPYSRSDLAMEMTLR